MTTARTARTAAIEQTCVARSGADALVPSFLQDSTLRLVLFGGKGGVGKTTCATATALTLARQSPGSSFLLVSTDPAHSVLDGLAGSALPPNLTINELDAKGSMDRFRSVHGESLKEIATRGTFLDDEDIQQFLDLSLPGLDELMAFLDLSEWIAQARCSCVVVDTAPWGHTLRLLEMPELLGKWLAAMDALLAKHRYMKTLYSGFYRPDRVDRFLLDLTASIDRMRATLRDSLHCRFVPVMLAEPLSVTETVCLLRNLDRLKIPVTDILVNKLYPDGSCPACTAERASQFVQVALTRDQIDGRQLWGLPLLPDETRGIEQLGTFWQQATGLPATLPTVHPLTRPSPRVVSPPELPSPDVRLLIFAGKGGVGKTTLACATALRLVRERSGTEVLLFSSDPAHSLSTCLDAPIGAEPTKIAPGLSAMEIDSRSELELLKQQYARELRDGLSAVAPHVDLTFDREAMERVLDLSPPGLDEIMALMRAMGFMTGGAYHVLVLDAAPTGHLIRLLEMPELIDRWLKAIFGVLLKYRGILRLPDVSERLVVLSKALKQFRAMLSDRARASLYAVTVPTEMAAAETADLLAACKRMAVSTPVLFLNQVTRNAPCSFCSALEHRESSVQDELIAAFPSVHQAVVYRCGEPRGMEHLAELGRLLYQERPGTR